MLCLTFSPSVVFSLIVHSAVYSIPIIDNALKLSILEFIVFHLCMYLENKNGDSWLLINALK